MFRNSLSAYILFLLGSILLAQHIVAWRQIENPVPPDSAPRQAYLLNAIALNAIKVQGELGCPGMIADRQHESAVATSNFTRFESLGPNRYCLYLDLLFTRLTLRTSNVVTRTSSGPIALSPLRASSAQHCYE